MALTDQTKPVNFCIKNNNNVEIAFIFTRYEENDIGTDLCIAAAGTLPQQKISLKIETVESVDKNTYTAERTNYIFVMMKYIARYTQNRQC